MDNDADVIFTGESAGDWVGVSVSGIGDINGDGFDDVIIGAPFDDENGSNAGKSYLYYGSALMDNSYDLTYTGEAAGDVFGFSVSGAGDVNGDGYSDIIIGAPGNDDGGAGAGKEYLYYGSIFPDNAVDQTFSDDVVGSNFGFTVANAGDVNNDGYEDILIGARFNNEGGPGAGKAYLYLGSGIIDNSPDQTFTGEASGDQFGYSLSSAGDVNDDGYDDFVIAAIANDELETNAGKVYLYYGSDQIDNETDITFLGEAASDFFGVSVSNAGDVNSDGYDDILIGAPGNDEGGVIGSISAGKTYLFTASGLAVKPNLFYANDVPFDQGGKVLLKWSHSSYDVPGMSTVIQYTIQRNLTPNKSGPWEYLADVSASHETYYAFVAQTQYDSTSQTSGIFYYRLVAKTNNSEMMWYSNIEPAYSVDNISPAAVQSLSANLTPSSNVELNWDKNTSDVDFHHYTIYRDTVAGFSPDHSSLLANTTTNFYTDYEPFDQKINYYKIISYDIHENPSEVSPEIAVDISLTAIHDDLGQKIPTKYELWQNTPNPFNPETKIRFAIPIDGRAILVVYNSIGQEVSVILSEFLPSGFHEVNFSGQNLSNGIYFYRFQSGDYHAIGKMILLK
jgi:hypothetical protein